MGIPTRRKKLLLAHVIWSIYKGASLSLYTHSCVVFFPCTEVEWMKPIQKENMSHMLASMHLVVRQADGKEETSGSYNHLTNTTYEKFIQRYG